MTETTSPPRTQLTELSARSTESGSQFNPHLLPHRWSFHLCCSIDKKGKFSRKRLNEDEGDITYINERNRVFNKKVGTKDSSVNAVTDPRHSCRLRGITTNIQQRFGQVSSAARLCNCFIIHVLYGRPSLMTIPLFPSE
jgi:hypothetical protein